MFISFKVGKYFNTAFFGFIALNLLLFLSLIILNDGVFFNKYNYVYNAHHHILDERQLTGKFKLINGLGVWDAQWYLRIADDGYPKSPDIVNIYDKRVMDGLTYAFFPLYPTIIGVFSKLTGDVEVAAFLVTNILLVLNFISLYFVISKFFGEKIAIKAIFLIFLFPFSIFFRSYFTEGLFLLLLVWFSYFLMRKNFVISGAFLGLLAITRPNGIFLAVVYLIFLFAQVIRDKKIAKALVCLNLALLPFLVWMNFNLQQTGTFYFWYYVQSEWFLSEGIFANIVTNLERISYFYYLPLHYFHTSKIDILTIIATMILLILSFGRIKPVLWLVSLVVWIFPLLVKDTMSYSRYQIVTFPIFIYLATVLKSGWYFLMCLVFGALLLVTSLYFVNWWWIG